MESYEGIRDSKRSESKEKIKGIDERNSDRS